MEIGSQFEDDFFEEPVLRIIKKPTNFEPKVYKPFWYMESIVGDGVSHEVLVTLKQKANFYYKSKKYAKAAEAYGRCLDLVPSSNSTWKREFLENIARSFLKLGDAEKALEWSLKLDETAINEDQKVISMNLLALVCHKLGKFKEELEALHSCMHAHKSSPEFWLRLALCYAGLFKIDLPGYPVPKVEDDEKFESEPCCAFNLKHYMLSCSERQKSPVSSDSNSSLENANHSAASCIENGACSNPPEVESLTTKCEFCTLGIQLVSSCLIHTKTLIDSCGVNRLGKERDEQLKEKISNCLKYMEVDQSFIDVASKMLGSDFLTLTDVYDNTLEPQKNCTAKQNTSSEKE